MSSPHSRRIAPSTAVVTVAVALLGGGCFVSTDATPHSSDPGVMYDYYEPCSFDDQCASGQCWEVTVDYHEATVTDSLCSAACSSDGDCPYGGLCLDVNGDGALCYEPCLDDAGCYSGFACVSDELGYDPVCLPY